MLKFSRFEPAVELNQFIQGYWQIESGNDTEVLDLVPDGFPELVFLLNSKAVIKSDSQGVQQFPNAGFIGQLTKRFVAVLAPGSKLMFVKLYPWTPALLFNDPVNELNNQVVELEVLSSHYSFHQISVIIRSQERISAAKELLDTFFIKHFSQQSFELPFLKFAVHQIYSSSGTTGVKALRKNITASRRYIEKLFKKNIGLTPKQYARLIRVKKASIWFQQEAFSEQIATVANALNYYDQSHFLKDFKMVVGRTPSQFLRQQINFQIDGLEQYLKQWDYS